jgi:hypothetical protein
LFLCFAPSGSSGGTGSFDQGLPAGIGGKSEYGIGVEPVTFGAPVAANLPWLISSAAVTPCW